METDEHPRPATTSDALANLPTPFRKGGSVTAGNSSGVNDGAAALIIASEEAAKEHGLRTACTYCHRRGRGYCTRIMGFGPAPATQKLLARTGLEIGRIGVIELNEAFASQALAVTRALGLPDDAPACEPEWRGDRARSSPWACPVHVWLSRPRTSCKGQGDLWPLYDVHRGRAGDFDPAEKGVTTSHRK